ncbi:MAG: GGDEF domain-containing protein [Firmicutes bacterium]|nr:GGDEF domain-containing protein [Bacillota bacterium]
MDRFKNIFKNVVFTIVVIMFLLGAATAQGQLDLTEEEKDYIARGIVLKGVTIDGVAPLHYTNSDGEIKGITIRILDEISEMTGLKFEYELYNSVDEALKSDYDIYLSATGSYAPADMILSHPYLKSETILFINSSVDPNYLGNKVYAGVKGGQLPEGVKEENAVYYGTREDTLNAVEKGKADYGYGNAYSVAYYTLLNGYRNIVTVPRGKESREYCIGFPKKNDVLLSIINKSIDAIDEAKMQTLVLDVTSHIDRKLNLSMVMDGYSNEIFIIAFLIISLLLFVVIFSVNINKRLRMQNKRYEALAYISNEYLYDYCVDTDELELSERSIQLFGAGRKLDLVIEKLKDAIFNTELICKKTSDYNDIPRSIIKDRGKGSYENFLIIKLPLSNGKTGIFKVISTIVKDDQGKMHSIIGKLVDVSKEVAEKEELITKAQLDGMTGLYNAATSKELIIESMRGKNKYKTDALIIIDCDNFKEINDNFGHLKGNEVLANISRAMKSIFRKTDITGRIGGDEFCIYIDGIPSKNFVQTKCEQLSNLITEMNQDIRISISMGIAFFHEEISYEELFQKADKALYQAKRRGGGEISVYNGE